MSETETYKWENITLHHKLHTTKKDIKEKMGLCPDLKAFVPYIKSAKGWWYGFCVSHFLILNLHHVFEVSKIERHAFEGDGIGWLCGANHWKTITSEHKKAYPFRRQPFTGKAATKEICINKQGQVYHHFGKNECNRINPKERQKGKGKSSIDEICFLCRALMGVHLHFV